MSIHFSSRCTSGRSESTIGAGSQSTIRDSSGKILLDIPLLKKTIECADLDKLSNNQLLGFSVYYFPSLKEVNEHYREVVKTVMYEWRVLKLLLIN